MNLSLEGGARRQEHEPARPIDWKDFHAPLHFFAADEFGAFFREQEKDTAWYPSLNDMHFRPVEERDVQAGRAEHARMYALPEENFSSGTEAALTIRAYHLKEEISTFKILGEKAPPELLEDLEDELGLIEAYFKETDAKQKALLLKDLDDMYAEMREGLEQADAAA